MSNATKSGIQTSSDGQAYIPASRRADGSTRKEIKVRPGYRPPEDVEKYQTRTAEAFRNRAAHGVPGAESEPQHETKTKNAKRREAARKSKHTDTPGADERGAISALDGLHLRNSATTPKPEPERIDPDVERQKKIRNNLKKLRAVQELKTRKLAGEKLSAEQLIKIGKEHEIVQDLARMGHNEDQFEHEATSRSDLATPS